MACVLPDGRHQMLLEGVRSKMGYDSHTYHNRGSWKKTLHEKAVFFEANTQERHNILGSFPSSVRLVPPKHYAGDPAGVIA